MLTLKPGYDGLVRFCKAIDEPLGPWQKRIAKAVFGESREVAAILPRGNAKTTIAALIGLHHLLTVENAAVTIGAASREQAAICFERMAGFAKHPELEDHILVRNLELRHEDRFGNLCLLRVVPAVGAKAHGLSSSLYIADEVWSWRDDAQLLEAMQTGLIKRPDAKLLVISTAAERMDSPLGRLKARAMGQDNVVTKGVVVESRGRLHWLEWTLPEDVSLDSMRDLKRVNPAPWITVDELERQKEAVPETAFAQFHANRWGVSEGMWLPAGAWHDRAAEFDIEEGETVWAGIDIGGSRAASAVVIVTEDLRIRAWTWQGDEAVLKVAAHVEWLAERFDIREAAYDPWRFRSEAMRLEEMGLPMVEFPQSHSRMIPASEKLYAAVVERRLKHSNDPVLNSHVASSIAKQTPRGWRIDKAHPEDQIDAVVALCMAIDRAEQPVERGELVGWI